MTIRAEKAELTLGPLLFNWAAGARRDFYFRIADEAPVDIVYLGEVVCPKRAPFFDDHLPEVIDRLQRAGKQVILSTPALIMGETDLALARGMAELDDVLVEANDVAALRLLVGRPHALGPFLNIYNEGTLDLLRRRGAARCTPPAEIPWGGLRALAAAGGGVTVEAQAFGRLPLAISARCYHARSRGLPKSACQYVCAEDADGMTVETLTGEPFLTVNGVQTLGHSVCSLLSEAPALAEGGVGAFRLWPLSVDMAAVASLFRDRLDGRVDGEAANERLAAMIPFVPLSNGFVHDAPGMARVGAA